MKLCSMKCDLCLEDIGGTVWVQPAEALSSNPEGVRAVTSNAWRPETPNIEAGHLHRHREQATAVAS